MPSPPMVLTRINSHDYIVLMAPKESLIEQRKEHPELPLVILKFVTQHHLLCYFGLLFASQASGVVLQLKFREVLTKARDKGNRALHSVLH
ncbi:hypothetical protein JZ751_002316 [Albula glossodonta]|uniref:Uncharacterized protein n=1 Tax=Albula glossodonta TaxID=121402 RepID=A0A8T2P9H0_9TELE|nr:hypothetical protein JZ751_002316 [Albula glossodonta]